MILDAAFYVRGVAAACGGALFWLLYFDTKDRLRPEPRRLLLAAFGLGCLSAGLGLLVFRVLQEAGAPEYPGAGATSILAYCVLLVGPVEEGVKFLVAAALIFRWRHFDEPIDGLIYSSAVAIGFATVENVLFLPVLGWPEQLARALASPLTHSLFSSLWGFAAGRAICRRLAYPRRLLWLGGALIAASLLHGLYDFVLLAFGAPWMAGGVALVLWIFLIVYARRIAHRPLVPARHALTRPDPSR